jgi:hypothetical protein
MSVQEIPSPKGSERRCGTCRWFSVNLESDYPAPPTELAQVGQYCARVPGCALVWFDRPACATYAYDWNVLRLWRAAREDNAKKEREAT